MPDSQIAVLIDFENVGLTNVRWLFDQVSDVGRIVIRRAYADWSTARRLRDQLLELGIEAVHLFHAAQSGKNASDLRLCIDAVDLLYQSEVDTFVIVSSDSDFVPLVSRLRAAGKVVIGAGPQATAPRTLVISCDRFFYLGQGDRAQPPPAPVERQEEDDLLSRAVRASIDEQGTVIGSKLHQTLQRLDPSFSFRSLGYSTFRKYLEASPQVKVARPMGQGDVIVETAESGAVLLNNSSDASSWGPKISSTWSRRAVQRGDSISGSAAAGDAAGVLGVPRLSVSHFKTLQGLISASEVLRASWAREGNRIVRL